jgi:hypothetical protein
MASEYTTAEGRLPAEATKILIAREHPKYWFAEHFTVGQIEAIADEIADINGDLLRLFMYLYGAPSAFVILADGRGYGLW